ncbi:hypothetical protein F4775DRAFT_548893 [Biscogniauxia sp. FL1348]|nr:hypothetical protein F4775DRAFT_548893 [Biscogniauxia sp. FL1348]
MFGIATLSLALAIAGLSSNSLVVRAADEYAWTLTWTGPKTCAKVPCPYSYNVSGPQYTTSTSGSAAVAIPSFGGSCAGTVDEGLAWCQLESGASGDDDEGPALAGNFSTYETSGVGSGQIAVALAWVDEPSGEHFTLTAVTPLQANEENQNTWEAHPTGCPLTGGEDCAPAPATSNGTSRRRQRRGFA